MHYLTDKLPKPNYADLQNSNYTVNNSPDVPRKRNKTGNNSLGKGSLPKINQLLKLVQNPMLENKKRNRSKGEGLMVEGKSKIIEEARNHEKYYNNEEKEINRQLRRIYLLKDVKST